MGRVGLRVWVIVCVTAVSLCVWQARSAAISLDKDGDMKLGVRTYVNARVGTESTHEGVPNKGNAEASNSATFPFSSAGHLRQNRAFIEVELNHDLGRLIKEGVGPLSLLNDLPFKIKSMAYHFTFRGEGDGLYDWGPNEYSTADAFNAFAAAHGPNPLVSNQREAFVQVNSNRRRLRRLGTDRERLFEAYLETSVGNLFLRTGRQVLSWGETDGFQLLDHINPIDSSFGGFLVGLDERRVPLDMMRAQYYFGDLGPVSEVFLEGYAAIDNKVGYNPGTPAGSPWALPSLGAPSNDTKTFELAPARTINNTRGGGRLVFNVFDATFSLAHYYTYFDTPALQVMTSGFPTNNNNKTLLNAFDDGLPCPKGNPLTPDPTNLHCGAPAHVFQTAPKVQVSGLTTTFALPQFYSVVRSELAYFKDEPSFSQGQLDPFLFNLSQPVTTRQQTGGRRLRDSINYVIGIDSNQWIRALNPNQTFLISTQFFYKHIRNAGDGPIYNQDGSLNANRSVLPVDLDLKDFFLRGSNVGRLEPIFITQPSDQFLQTLFIGTSYRSGTVNPGLTVFYDWGGAFVYQPAITLVRDPFRFTMDYSILDAHTYKGGSGVSLLKDRDNVQFRVEYVI